MEEQNHDNETTMQEQENDYTSSQSTITHKKRGRPPKNQSIQSTTQFEVVHVQPTTNTNNSELEFIKSQLQQLQQENQNLKRIVDTISVTTTKTLVNCTDDEINMLYVDYITQKQTEHDNALIIEHDDKLIIPKSYYVID